MRRKEISDAKITVICAGFGPAARLASVTAASRQTWVTTANGRYGGAEIYYIDHGIEEGVTAREQNDTYLIGSNRLYQAQVVEFMPGRSPHAQLRSPHSRHRPNKTVTVP